MTRRVYGNAIAVFDPDPRAAPAITQTLGRDWTCSIRHGWLIAHRPIGDVASPVSATAADGTDVLFVEDAAGSCDPEPFGAATPLRRVAPDGDVTALTILPGGRVRVARSCAGTVPVYLAHAGSRVVVSTLIEPLTRIVPAGPRVDAFGLAGWLGGFGFFPAGRTWLEGVTVVPAGHAAEIATDGSVALHRYWDPRPHSWPKPTPAPRVHADHVTALRAAVLSSLERTLDEQGRNLLTISGGADSTLLGHLIAGRLGRAISTLSFRSPAPGEAAIQARAVDAFVAAHPPRRRWTFGATMPERLEMLRGSVPLPLPTTHPALQLLPTLAAEQPIAVLVGGEFADHVTGGAHHHTDWLEAASPLTLAAAAARGRLPGGVKDPALWVRHRMRARPFAAPPVPRFLAAPVRAEFEAWIRDRQRRLAADRRPWRHLAARMELEDGVTAMNWEACSAAQVLRVFPFLQRATLETVFDCHPCELIGPGVKKLMRQAFAGEAPAEVLSRGKYRGRDGHHPPVAVEPVPEAEPLLDPRIRGPFDGVEALMIAGMNHLLTGLALSTAPKPG